MLTEKEFVELLNKHQNIIHKICNVYMDNAADKEDLFQEITLQAWKSIKNFRGVSQFSTWLYRVALNTAITFYRKERKQVNVTFTEHFPETKDEYDPIEDQVQAMYKAIAGLSKIEKALVMLYLEDYSYKGMAEVLGITVTNVGVKMNRLKTKLKDETNKYYHPIN
jgi:RNA polymerase sigma factor (sigma-70 family)